MEIFTVYHHFAAATIARVFLGLLFFFQGYDAVFGIGLKKVTATYREGFASKGIPQVLTAVAAWFTAYTELLCGALLIVGLFEIPALYLLGLNLLVAATGFGIATPLWDTRHVFPRLVLLLLLLFIPAGWHAWSLDALFFHP